MKLKDMMVFLLAGFAFLALTISSSGAKPIPISAFTQQIEQ